MQAFQLAHSANEGVPHRARLLKVQHFPALHRNTVHGGPRGLSQSRWLCVGFDLDNCVRDCDGRVGSDAWLWVAGEVCRVNVAQGSVTRKPNKYTADGGPDDRHGLAMPSADADVYCVGAGCAVCVREAQVLCNNGVHARNPRACAAWQVATNEG